MKNFTNLYSLSKTLRFELKPIGKTLEHIQEKGLLTQDQQRAERYQKMKKTIDEFHKWFIDLALNRVSLNLNNYVELYRQSPETKKDEKHKFAFKKEQEILRKQIVKAFSDGDAKDIYINLFKKELITNELEKWISKHTGKSIAFFEDFKTFTTYFTGFHENRKNMYTAEEKSTAIAYRLINENLPKFLENVATFEKINQVESLKPKLDKVYTDFEEYLNVRNINEIFELDYFNLVLTQQGIDVYNYILGGKTETDGKPKIQGINEIVNLYNQNKDKKDRLPKLKQLYKQILSDRVSLSFLPEAFENSQDVLNAIYEFYNVNLLSFKPENADKTENLLVLIQQLLGNLSTYQLEKIYLKNDTNLTTISQKIFGDFGIFQTALNYRYENIINPKYENEYKKASERKRDDLEKLKAKYTKQDYFSIAYLQETLEMYMQTLEEANELKQKYTPNCVADYFKNHFLAKKEKEDDKTFDLLSNITAKYQCIKGILENRESYDDELKQDQKLIDDLKFFLDALLEMLHFIKPLHLKSESITEKETAFYDVFETYYEELSLLTSLYNMVRNYVTQKPYSTKKVKLNFKNAQLLNGWDANKESDYLTTLLRKDGNYYLAIMDKEYNKELSKVKAGKNNYEKVVYKLLPGVNKQLPRVFFAAKNIAYYNPSKELLENYKNDTHKKGDTFNINDCHNLIDFFKASINKHEDWKNFNFQFSDTTTYEDLSGFYREVEAQGYKITFKNIDSDQINELVNQGKLYLFQIYNKDFSPHSKGKPNLHTLYWKALFEEQNLKDVIYKLNGQAEIFFREKSIKDKNIITHTAKQPIKAKNPLTPEAYNTFDYVLTKDKRYTVDKFQFHVPITLNFKAQGNSYINQNVWEYLKENPEVKIIGLDRGERHLIYLSLIDQNGKILEQYSFNTIKDEKIETPYHTLLHNKEVERDNARKNWRSIENIKELKEGYISQVVHQISKMMVEHNAIVVMEDLNFGFKRGRFKVEKQIYQKLEKMLIDKLNYLVLKDKQPNELGGIYKALQLANKFESFQKMGKQSGFIFYVPAWNTSKIDPITGFVNYFYTKYENVEKAQKFFDKFESIRFNTKNNYFEFIVKNYSNFNPKADDTCQEWTICTYGERIETKRQKDQNNNFVSTPINLTEKIEDFLGENNIIYGDGSCIKKQLVEKGEKNFFEELLYWFKMTLQIRNSISGTDEDYLISPVADANGTFYDSRKVDATLPQNADANGAYNIARKGLIVLDKINKADLSKKVDLSQNNREWLNFVQKNS